MKFFPLDLLLLYDTILVIFQIFTTSLPFFPVHNIPEDPIFTTVYFFDMRAVRIRNRKASITINSLFIIDNSIRQTLKEPCLPLAPLFESLVGHHSYTDTYYQSQRCVSQRFQPLLKESGKYFLAPKVWTSRGICGYAPPGNLTNLISLKQHFLHFDTVEVFNGETHG